MFENIYISSYSSQRERGKYMTSCDHELIPDTDLKFAICKKCHKRAVLMQDRHFGISYRFIEESEHIGEDN